MINVDMADFAVDGATTATVSRIDPRGDLTVNLFSDDTSEAIVVSTVVIADGQIFNLRGVPRRRLRCY